MPVLMQKSSFVYQIKKVADAAACQCGEILKGVLKPWQCKVFGTTCTPDNLIGTCMVSSEGACAAYYEYGRCLRWRRLQSKSWIFRADKNRVANC